MPYCHFIIQYTFKIQKYLRGVVITKTEMSVIDLARNITGLLFFNHSMVQGQIDLSFPDLQQTPTIFPASNRRSYRIEWKEKIRIYCITAGSQGPTWGHHTNSFFQLFPVLLCKIRQSLMSKPSGSHLQFISCE